MNPPCTCIMSNYKNISGLPYASLYQPGLNMQPSLPAYPCPFNTQFPPYSQYQGFRHLVEPHIPNPTHPYPIIHDGVPHYPGHFLPVPPCLPSSGKSKKILIPLNVLISLLSTLSHLRELIFLICYLKNDLLRNNTG